MINPWRKIDNQVKKGLVEDKGLNNFLNSFFDSDLIRKKFINKCLKKQKTRRMLLCAQWYSEIANGLDVVKSNRPALQIIFLMSLAEGVARLRIDKDGDDTAGSRSMIKEFFSCTTTQDKKRLVQKFQRALVKIKHHNLRFSSVANILYDIRNRAVHGNDFYSFSLLNENQKKEFVDGGYTHYGIMTVGFLGKSGKIKGGNKRRKQRVSLDISLTYKELRDIIIRTAIENIEKVKFQKRRASEAGMKLK